MESINISKFHKQPYSKPPYRHVPKTDNITPNA